MSAGETLLNLQAKAAECRNLAAVAREPGVALLLIEMAEKYEKQAELKQAGERQE